MDSLGNLLRTAEMDTKLNKIRQLAAAEEWGAALRIAARFADLGQDRAAIIRAHEVSHSPSFYRQIGVDPDEAMAAGIAALKARYSLRSK